MTVALEGVEWSAARPGHTLSPGKTRYPLYRRLGGPHGQSVRAWKISPTPGFNPRTVQPVVSRYTDWATRPKPLRYTTWIYVLVHTQSAHRKITVYLYSTYRFTYTNTTEFRCNKILTLMAVIQTCEQILYWYSTRTHTAPSVKCTC
jgi:hypothetical protein